ncbi:MAG TPA: hypothetical protein DEB05_04595 [Firmicutes bacterium]|mgnify:FL=1|nr:hypothetical protein [Bacillota bacterium]
MKRMICVALLLSLVAVGMVGCGKKSETPTPVRTDLWGFETEAEVAAFDNDNTDAVLAYDQVTVFKGIGSIKITPGGKPETKIAAKLPVSAYDPWKKSKVFVVNLYMEEGMDPAINTVFLGMADLGPDGDSWDWVSGSFYKINSPVTGWNKCPIGLLPSMKNLDSTHQYKLYIGFYNEDEMKITTALANVFFVDAIYIE